MSKIQQSNGWQCEMDKVKNDGWLVVWLKRKKMASREVNLIQARTLEGPQPDHQSLFPQTPDD